MKTIKVTVETIEENKSVNNSVTEMMRKTALLLALLLFVLPVTANAVTPRIVNIVPSINFVGNTANCSVYVTGNSTKDNITAVVKLWDGGNCIALWTGAGSGYLNMTKSKEVTKGVEYIMTVSVTINGVTRPTVSTYGTC